MAVPAVVGLGLAPQPLLSPESQELQRKIEALNQLVRDNLATLNTPPKGNKLTWLDKTLKIFIKPLKECNDGLNALKTPPNAGHYVQELTTQLERALQPLVEKTKEFQNELYTSIAKSTQEIDQKANKQKTTALSLVGKPTDESWSTIRKSYWHLQRESDSLTPSLKVWDLSQSISKDNEKDGAIKALVASKKTALEGLTKAVTDKATEFEMSLTLPAPTIWSVLTDSLTQQYERIPTFEESVAYLYENHPKKTLGAIGTLLFTGPEIRMAISSLVSPLMPALANRTGDILNTLVSHELSKSAQLIGGACLLASLSMPSAESMASIVKSAAVRGWRMLKSRPVSMLSAAGLAMIAMSSPTVSESLKALPSKLIESAAPYIFTIEPLRHLKEKIVLASSSLLTKNLLDHLTRSALHAQSLIWHPSLKETGKAIFNLGAVLGMGKGGYKLAKNLWNSVKANPQRAKIAAQALLTCGIGISLLTSIPAVEQVVSSAVNSIQLPETATQFVHPTVTKIASGIVSHLTPFLPPKGAIGASAATVLGATLAKGGHTISAATAFAAGALTSGLNRLAVGIIPNIALSTGAIIYKALRG